MVTRRPDIEREVLGEIERAAGRPVRPEDGLDDLGLDSLALTALAVELEDRFRVRLDGAGGAAPRTVGEVVELIAGRARRRAEGA